MNNDVSRIVGITKRQVLGWSEKGLVIPRSEAAGAGVKRNYNYINLLEFGLCKALFSMWQGVQTVKKILGELRQARVINDWAENFSAYYKMVFKKNMDHYLSIKKSLELQKDPKNDSFFETYDKKITEGPYKPEEPKGILIYFFEEKEKKSIIIPWDMNYVMNLNIIKEGLARSTGSLVVDLGKIKKEIDKNL